MEALMREREEEEILPRCRGGRRRRCTSAALARGCEQRRCCARWRAASLELCALEKEARAREEWCGGEDRCPLPTIYG